MARLKVGTLPITEGDFLGLEIIGQGGSHGHRGFLCPDLLEEVGRLRGFLG
jgi:hypothetical protein